MVKTLRIGQSAAKLLLLKNEYKLLYVYILWQIKVEGSTSRRRLGLYDSLPNLKVLKVYSGSYRNIGDKCKIFTLKACRVEKCRGILKK